MPDVPLRYPGPVGWAVRAWERRMQRKQVGKAMKEVKEDMKMEKELRRAELKKQARLEKKAGLNRPGTSEKMSLEEQRKLLRPPPMFPITAADRRKKMKMLLLARAAQAEAEQRWLDEYVRAILRQEEKQWTSAADQRARDVESMRRADDDAVKKAAKDASLRDKAEEKVRQWNRQKRRAETRKKIGIIPNFEKACPKAKFCEHVRAKAWGDKYANPAREISAPSMLWPNSRGLSTPTSRRREDRLRVLGGRRLAAAGTARACGV